MLADCCWTLARHYFLAQYERQAKGQRKDMDLNFLPYRSAVPLQTLATMDCHISLSLVI